jgi:hypothetical protein
VEYEISTDEDRGSFISHARVRSAARTERDPLVGDIVHYWDDNAAACRAALVFGLQDVSFDEPPTADLYVFQRSGHRDALDVPHMEARHHHTWHWPESE